jgi:RNA polymerase sigma-B factor
MLQSNRSSPRRPTRRSRRARRRYAIDVTAPPPRAVAHPDHPDGDRVARDRRLFGRYRDGTGAPTDRDDVVVRFLPLARQLAARYARPPEPFEDVYQVACMALVKAVDRYDADREVAFSSYAVPTIVGEIKRYYRDHTWVVHVPRDLAELAVRVQRTTADLTSRTGRPATLAEIAAELGVGEDEVRQARDAIRARRPTPLELDDDDDAARAPGLDTCHGVEEPGYERAEQRALLAELLRHVPPRDRAAVCLYFQGDLTQADIGARLGVSQMQVSRILERSLARLRELPVVLDQAA